MSKPVLAVQDLSVALPAGADRSHALQNISLMLNAAEKLCVVGESGSGKSVLAMAVMGLLARELRVTAGRVMLQNESLLEAGQTRLRALRGLAMGMVFQEPMTALNPVMRCGEQIDEVLRCHTDHGHGAQTRLADLRRTHHGAGRDHTAGNIETHQTVATRQRHSGVVHHARHGRGG